MPGDEALEKSGAPRALLLLTFLLALALRALIASRSACIYADGAVELLMAQDFTRGDVLHGLRRVFHPLYASSIALFSPLQTLGFTAESIALAISALAGAGTAATLVDITWRISQALDRRRREQAARLAAAWAILHPALALQSSQVLAYGLTHLALALSFRQLCLSQARLRDDFKAGLFLGLGFLGRPDVSLAAFGAGLASLDWQRKLAPLRLSLGFALLAGPYIAWVSLESGRFRLSLKKDPAAWAKNTEPQAYKGSTPRELEALISSDSSGQASAAPLNWPRSALRALDQSRKAVHEPIFAMALLGLALQRRREGKTSLATRFAILASLSFLLGHTVLQRFAGYLSLSHCSYQTILWLPLAASAGPQTLSFLRTRLAAKRPLARRTLLLVLVLGPLAPRLADIYKAPLSNKAAMKILGEEWSQRPAPEGGWLMLGRECRALAYYANSDYLELDELARHPDRIQDAHRRGALLLIHYQRSLNGPPEAIDPARLQSLGLIPLMEKNHQERSRFYRWQLYKIQRWPE